MLRFRPVVSRSKVDSVEPNPASALVGMDVVPKLLQQILLRKAVQLHQTRSTYESLSRLVGDHRPSRHLIPLGSSFRLVHIYRERGVVVPISFYQSRGRLVGHVCIGLPPSRRVGCGGCFGSVLVAMWATRLFDHMDGRNKRRSTRYLGVSSGC